MLGASLGVIAPLFEMRAAQAHTPHDSISDVAFSPDFAQDRTVYTISRRFLLKSTDGGETWKKLVRSLDNKIQLRSVEVSSQDANMLYAASPRDGVYKSTDAGSSWTKANTGLPSTNVRLLSLSPRSDDTALAALPDGLFATRDGGASWSRLETLPDGEIGALAFAPDADGVVLVGGTDGSVHLSGDGGATWQSTTIETADAGGVTALAVSPGFTGDGTFFVGTESGGVFKTSDRGATYEPVNDGLSDTRVTSLLVSRRYETDSTLWATAWKEGVFVSTDGGSSWSKTSKGLTAVDQADLVGVAHFGLVQAAFGANAEEPPTMFVAGFDGLFRSTTGGESWDEVQTQASTNIAAVAVSPDYANDSTIAVATYINGAFLSEDGGDTWRAINNGLAARNEWLRAPDYVSRLLGIRFSPTYRDDHTLFSVLRGYVLRSSTRGDEWEAQIPRGVLVKGENPPDYFIPAFSPAFARDQTMVLVTDGGKVFRSTDAGRSFSKVATVDTVFTSLVISPQFSNDGTLFAAADDGVYVSTDRGDTWEATDGSPDRVTGLAISTDYGRDRTVFAGTWNGLYKTSNGGRSWEQVVDTPYGANGFIEAVAISPAFTDDKTLLVSVRGRGLFKSTDAAASFREVGRDLIDANVMFANWYHYTSGAIEFSPTYARDNTIFGFAESNVYRSQDGGETWTELVIPPTVHETTEEAAAGTLLVTPRFETGYDAVSGSGGGSTGDLAPRRVMAAIAAALTTLLLLLFALLRRRSMIARLTLSLGGSVVVLVGLLLLFDRWP